LIIRPKVVSTVKVPNEIQSINYIKPLIKLVIILALCNLISLIVILLNFTELNSITTFGACIALDVIVQPFNIKLHNG